MEAGATKGFVTGAIVGGVTGAVFGLLIPRSDWRRRMAGGLAGLALIVLLVQVGIGFPAERRMNKALVEMAVDDALAFDAHYTPWFWIGLVCNLAAVVGVSLEWLILKKSYLSWFPSG